MSKNFDEAVRLQSDKREEWIQKLGGEKIHGTAEGRSSASRQASSLAASYTEKFNCMGIHCSLIVQEERKRESKDNS